MLNKFKSLAIGTAIALASSSACAYSVQNGKILDDNSHPVQLRGINWSGFESGSHVISGLSKRNWKDMIVQMQGIGFNAVRLPYCPDSLHGTTVDKNAIDYTLNPDLQNLNSQQIMDKIVGELSQRGMYVLLDNHSPDCRTITPLWYTDSYSDSQWISDLRLLADHYKNIPGVIGVDLKNELHGSATWGTGNKSTDWNSAAERGSSAILAIAPKWLIAVEGIGFSSYCYSDTNYSFFWGENFEPLDCKKLAIPTDRLVLSPHTYGPDTYPQSYMSDANFPNNMPGIWEQRFGHFVQQGYSVILGEFGGQLGRGDKRDIKLENALVDYLLKKGINSGFYWTWNPDSNDTGGVLENDFKTIRDDKVTLLKRLWGNYSTATTPAPTTPVTTTPAPTAPVATTPAPTAPVATTPAPTAPVTAKPAPTAPVTTVPTPTAPVTTKPAQTAPVTTAPAPTAPQTQQPQAPVKRPVAQASFAVQARLSYQFGFMYCERVDVTNTGDASGRWTVAVPVNGFVTGTWNAFAQQFRGRLVATGLMRNRVLAPGASTEFSFCAFSF